MMIIIMKCTAALNAQNDVLLPVTTSRHSSAGSEDYAVYSESTISDG